MTRVPFDEEVTETFVLALLTALAQGPIGEATHGQHRHLARRLSLRARPGHGAAVGQKPRNSIAG